MRLSAKVIKNYANINNFDFANQWQIRAGDPNTLYFQLVDLDMSDSDGKNPLRYMAGIGGGNQPVVLNVVFPSIDDAQVLTLVASQVDAADASLWKVDLTSAQIPGSGNVIFSIAEGSNIRSFSVINAMSVEYPGNDGSC